MNGVKTYMRKRQLRWTAVMLAAALMAGNAYAAPVELAQYPGAQTTQTSDTDSTQAAAGTENSLTQGATEGPGGTSSGTSGESAGGPGVSGGSVIETTAPGTGSQSSTAAGTSTPGSTTDTAQQGGSAQTTVTENANIQKPEIASETAVLMDASTGQLLYSKNADQKMYPASTTKLMTALVTAENAALDDMVTYKASAVENLESGAANINLSAGDQMSVKDSLYALLLKSACEVANGLAEHVSGTQAAFAEKMNQRAKELGCLNTNFTNPSGLNDTAHVTTAYDMALITRAALQNETVRSIAGTISYELPEVARRGKLTIYNGHKMLNSANEQYYRGIVAGKTGYTSKAGNTLATEVTRDGKTLIAVVMKSNNQHYSDTKKLFDYGFQLLGVADTTENTIGQNAAGGSGTTGGNTSSDNAAGATGWRQNGSAWNYVKSDGTLAKSEWIDIGDKSYYIGSDNNMITGWQKFSNGAYYYFDETSGAMLRNAWKNEGTGSETRSYYLLDDGTMAVNQVVDTKQGKYRVDENGVAVEKIS